MGHEEDAVDECEHFAALFALRWLVIRNNFAEKIGWDSLRVGGDVLDELTTLAAKLPTPQSPPDRVISPTTDMPCDVDARAL